jgi:signal transduction histidine kinase
MNLIQKLFKKSLVGKIVFTIILSIIFTQLIQVIAFEYFLKQKYADDASVKITEALKAIQNDLKKTQQNLLKNISYVNTNDSILASIYFVNNYQNKQSYDAILIDEEKKRIADELLDRVKLSSNTAIALYDSRKELIAFVYKEDDIYVQHIISYENSQPVIYEKNENQKEYKHNKKHFKFQKNSRITMVYNKLDNKINYQFNNRQILDIKANEVLVENGKTIGYIDLIKSYDNHYFQQLSKQFNLYINLSTTVNKNSTNYKNIFDTNYSKDILDQNKNHLWLIRTLKTLQNDVQFTFKLDKHIVDQQINENRQLFLIITILVLFLISIVAILILKNILVVPLDTLMDQIEHIKSSEYDKFKSLTTKDELEVILTNLHELSSVIKSRENEIREQMSESQKKDKIIADREKLASMGEMIGNIAHQWRQPLSVISTAATGIQVKQEYDLLTNDELIEYCKSINNNAQYLSETIDTFRDFIKEKKEFKSVILQERIQLAIGLEKASLQNNHIELIDEIDYDTPLRINIVMGELTQVIMNVINNAKDVLIEKKISQPWIKIEIYKKDDTAVIAIEDNGGGIQEDIISKIFEPYFTTKHKSKGTGLGLHMSYRIVNESLKGNLYATNTPNGAKFTIQIPIAISHTDPNL